MSLTLCPNCGQPSLLRHACVAWQVVSTDLDGPSARHETVYATSAQQAIERWCEAYDRDRGTGQPLAAFGITVVMVRKAGADIWEPHDVQVITVRQYRAVPRIQGDEP